MEGFTACRCSGMGSPLQWHDFFFVVVPLTHVLPLQELLVPTQVYQQNLTMLQHAFDSAQEAFPNQVGPACCPPTALQAHATGSAYRRQWQHASATTPSRSALIPGGYHRQFREPRPRHKPGAPQQQHNTACCLMPSVLAFSICRCRIRYCCQSPLLLLATNLPVFHNHKQDFLGIQGYSPDLDFKAAAAIWHTAIYLSFPQVHNTMAALAAAWGFDLYAWMHADAVVLKTESAVGGRMSESVYKLMLVCIDARQWRYQMGSALRV
eukprot:1145167-Pelagomonas_calceolata.AAC.1